MNTANQNRGFPWFLLIVFVSLVLGILITGYFYYRHRQNQTASDAHRNLEAIADLKTAQIARWRDDRMANAKTIRDNAPLHRRIAELFKNTSDAKARQEILTWMISYQKNYGYAAMILLDAQGNARLSTPAQGIGPGSHSQSLLHDAVRNREAIFSDFTRIPETQSIQIDMLLPLISPDDKDGKVFGIILLCIDPLTELYPLIQSWPTPSRSSETLLIEREGNDIVYLNELRFRKNSALKLRLPATEEQLTAAMAARGVEGTVEGLDYRGVPVLAAIRKIPNAPWFMIAKVDKEEVNAPLHLQFWYIASTVLVLIFSAASIVALWWRHQRALFYRGQYEAELEREALVTHFDYIVKYANDIILLMNLDGKIVEANDQAYRAYGYLREELLHLNIRDLRSEESRPLVEMQMKQVQDRGGMVFEAEHQRKNGTTFPVEVSSRLIRIEDAKFLQSIIRDISDRKHTAEELQKREAQQSLVLSSLPMAFYIARPYGDYGGTWVSEQIDYISGFTREQFANDEHLWASRIHPEDRERALSDYDKILEKDSIEMEYRWQAADGRYRWFMDRAVLTRDSNGRPREIIGTWLDITERKQVEQALRESEEKYRSLSENSLEGIGLSNGEQVVYANKALLNIFGYDDVTEFMSKPLLEHIAPGSQNTIREMLQQSEKGVPGEKRFVYQIIRKDGGIRDLEISTDHVVIRNEVYTQSTFRDVTERKKAEEALRSLSARNEAILAAVPDIIMEVDNNKVYRWANPAGVEFFGKDVIGKEASFYFEGNQETYDHVQPVFEGQESTIYVESWQRRKDGEKRLLAWWCRSLRDAQGNVSGALSTAQDITERKLAEEAMRESEERYRRIFEQSPVGIGIAYLDGRIFSANKTLQDIMGYSIEELRAVALIDTYVDKEARNELLKTLSGTGTVFDFSTKLRRKDGAVYDALLNVSYIKLGGKDFIQTIVQDVTNRKRTEEALHESEEKYKILFADARQAIFIADVESGMLIDCNEAACALIERSRDEIIGKHQSILHPVNELVDGSSQSYRKHISSGAGLLIEDRVITKSGKIKEVEIKGNLVEFKGKKILQGFFIDITERKRAEAALKESEERYRRLVESVTDYIYSVKLEAGRPISTSHGPACETVTGYTSAEYAADPDLWYRMVYEEDRKVVEELTTRVLSGTEVSPLEHRIKHKNGSIRWVRNTPVLKHNAQGTLISYDGLIADITERKEAEEALRQSHSFNDMLIQTMPFGMDIVDEKGTILFMSKAMRDIAGSDAVGKRCWQMYKDNKQQCQDCPLKHDIVFGKTDILETAGVFGGRIFQISHVGMVYEGKQAMLEVFQDITEQKKLQQEILQSQKMLSIGTLAGGIAHDFNNILGIILGYISIMQSIKDNPKKFSEGIHAIRQAVDRGAGLVRQILTFARKAEVSFEPLYLPDLVKELVSMLQQTFPKIITFETSIDKELPLINADYTQIHQALLNLCVNARDALPNGGEISIKAVTVTGEKTRERFPAAILSPYICISISDTGVGMEEATRNRIFDPFFTTKEKGKGTGLGLSVVYGIIQSHRGFINCESHVGKGTDFHLYLPVPQEPANANRAQAKEDSVAPSGNETILLVEDEDLLLEMMETLLKTRGYKVYKAKDGIEAIGLYERHMDEISLILTDMGLPKLTGVDEFERLKVINPDVKLIFASGYLDPRAKDELLKAGAKGFLQKPYVIEEVLKKIREALDSK